MRTTPFDHIAHTLSERLPQDCLLLLPKKWEKIGTVVVLQIPKKLTPYLAMIGQAYAEELRCSSALNDVSGISGVYRNPTVKVIWGSAETETMHKENGVRYLLDPQKVMFSSGNMTERRRMATIANRRETVVDLFAGIGYFTIPMAVHSRPKRIVACEMNPVAFDYLKKNIVLNRVSDIVEPLLGDNRTVAPKGCADRVIVGYFRQTQLFLPTVLECLRNHKGVVHYHDLMSRETTSQNLFQRIQNIAEGYHRQATLLLERKIKSYAPGIDHVVLDVRIDG